MASKPRPAWGRDIFAFRMREPKSFFRTGGLFLVVDPLLSSVAPAARAAPEPTRVCPECQASLARTGIEEYCTRCGLVVNEDLIAPIEVALTRPTTPVPRSVLPQRFTRHGSSPPRSLARARATINRLASQLAIPNYVAIDAFYLVRRLHARHATQGRRRDATCAAALLEAARDRGIPRTAREFTQAANVTMRELHAALGAIGEATGSRVLPAAPDGLVPRVASEAQLPPDVEPLAVRLIREAGARATGRRPEPIVAAGLLLAARRLGHDANAVRLAKAAGISRQALYVALHELELTAPP